MSLRSVFGKIGRGVLKVTTVIEPFSPLLSMIPGFGITFGVIQEAEKVLSPASTKLERQDAILQVLKDRFPNTSVLELAHAVDQLGYALQTLDEIHKAHK